MYLGSKKKFDLEKNIFSEIEIIFSGKFREFSQKIFKNWIFENFLENQNFGKLRFLKFPIFFHHFFFKLFFQLDLKKIVFEVGKNFEYVFRFRIRWTFQWCYFQSDSGTSSGHTDRFSNKLCFKTRTFWWNPMGQLYGRRAHIIERHMGYTQFGRPIKECTLFKNSMRLLKTTK